MLRAGVAAVLCSSALLLGGCGDGSATPPAPISTPPSAPSGAATEVSPTASAGSEDAAASCLFTVPQVSRVLGGRWKRTPRAGQPCAYGSDRGALFVTNIVDDDPVSGMRDARKACARGVKPISTAHGGFVCVELHDTGNVVIGNVARAGKLWLVLIPLAKGADPEPQLRAMIALMDNALG